MVQAEWVLLSTETKKEFSILVMFLLQMTAHISLFRSRQHIIQLLNRISGIFKILHWKCSKKNVIIPMSIYCIAINVIAFSLGAIYYISTLTVLAHQQVKNSTNVDDNFKRYFLITLDIKNVTTAFVLCCLNASFSCYYCFVSYYMSLLFFEFISKSQGLIAKEDYHSILHVYHELTDTLTYMDDFLSYPVFIHVLGNMAGLFWSSYAIIFIPTDDYLAYIYLIVACLLYWKWLLMIMLPASSANKAAKNARDIILSLPGWFPQHHRKLKLAVRREFKQTKYALTLWKTYLINRSILISALGTLITYGIIIATFGSVKQ
ncbi:uncharacterized protein TNCT_232961 [Trichonephila clavata]|uniref:Gustatory receptor n=1 Tax=Trichonephila clavata TaxID=2740835 RepID=A0A8X6LBY7_TRICU|nr:uncharacterized protein TNCT_232961 [Trichonephila clavata]